MGTVGHVSVYPTFAAADAAGVKTRSTLRVNETSTLDDTVFDAFRNKTLTAQERAQLRDWNFRLEQSEEAIEEHLEQRVSLLFMQAVVCYGTGYQFAEGHTLHQGSNAETLKAGHLALSFQAAHHATLPNLYARSPTSQQNLV